jgi:ubiquinone/menaquinone biosynthesis C-methylase UbiE
MSQKEVWNSIAKSWKEFRKKPVPEIVYFLKDKKGKVLDLGCGSGRNFTKIRGTIYGVDFSREMLKFAKQTANKNKIKVNLTLASSDNLPFQDNFFDSAICIASLHCIQSKKSRKRTLEELYRVLKPGTKAMIVVWDKNQSRFKNSGKETLVPWKHKEKEQMRYYYLYDKKEIKDLLKSVGFKILKISDIKTPKAISSKKNIDIIVRK